MTIKEELVKKQVAECIAANIRIPDYDINSIASDTALKALEEIKAVIFKHDRLSDFDIVDEIVDIFTKYGIDTRGCHDFG